MSIEAVGKVATWWRSGANPSLQALGFHLGDMTNAETGQCNPSLVTLATRLNCEERTVRRLLQEAEEKGLLRREYRYVNGRQTSTQYCLLASSNVQEGTNLSPRPDASVPPGEDTSVRGEEDTSVRQNQEVGTRKKRTSGAGEDFELDPRIDPTVWQEWVEHRKSIRKPMKGKALTLNAGVLVKLSRQEQREAVERAIASGWQGLYPPRSTSKQAQPVRQAGDYFF